MLVILAGRNVSLRKYSLLRPFCDPEIPTMGIDVSETLVCFVTLECYI